MNEGADDLYAELGLRPPINAAGAYTILGGSRLSPAVQAAMATANQRFADMKALLESSGRVVADLLGAEAAYITSGAAAALALSVAACLTREHRDYLERLPDTQGIPNEVLVQRSTRQKYDRCLSIPGARIVEVGGADGLTPAQLAAAIGPRTAAVHYFAPLQGPAASVPPLEAVIEVAHGRGLPVVVDAAGQTYPLDNFRRYARAGADLVCYAAKYFDAPHSTGMVVGKRELVELVALNGFVGFETSAFRTIGRPMKVDRQEVVAAVVALREWLGLNHEERLLKYGERAEVILAELKGVAAIDAFRISQRETPKPVLRDGVRLELKDAKRAQALADALREGEPSVWVNVEDGAVNVSVAFCDDADVAAIARRLREALTA